MKMKKRMAAAVTCVALFAAACGASTPIEELQLSDLPPAQFDVVRGNCQIEIDNGYTTTPVDECLEQWIVDERASSRQWGIDTVEKYLSFYP
jgi:hypothetical protein